MKIISFAETTPALLAGQKTVTRREWSERHARSFAAGELVQAWCKSPRVKGARRVGTIRLTQAPYWEWSADIPYADWEAEGFAFMQERGLKLFNGLQPADVWLEWTTHPLMLCVVRFELVEVVDEAGDLVAPGAPGAAGAAVAS